MTTEPLFVARLKKGGFTRTGTVDEVMALLDQLMPIDMLYCLSPLPAGNGYALVEAGIPIIDIRTIDQEANPKANTRLSEPVPAPISNGSLPSPRSPSVYDPVSQSWSPIEGNNRVPHNQPEPPLPSSSKQAKRKTKKTKGKKAQTKDLPEEQLPNVVSKGGITKVTHISTATPEQAERASKFGKSH